LARIALFVQGRRSPGDAPTLKKRGDQNCFYSHPFICKKLEAAAWKQHFINKLKVKGYFEAKCK